MNKLYPIKFKPIYKKKIWGGNKIKSILKKDFSHLSNCGESWEISGVQNEISVVSNGFLKGNNLQEIIEIYMGDLVGDKVYNKFGIEFPLLIKFIDANDVLSIQVHPDDELANKRHNAYGKTEMWYIIQADENAELISGFNKKIDEKVYKKHLENKTLKEILNIEKVSKGDVFFIPAGRVHSICSGILLAEIQQTSDITYRIYDWDRKDAQGNHRKLHTGLAIDAIDYNYYDNYKTIYKQKLNESSNIVDCNYFTTNILQFNKSISKDYNTIDSFVIYICLEGEYSISYETKEKLNIKKGETILLPAVLRGINLLPKANTKIIEVYINQ